MGEQCFAQFIQVFHASRKSAGSRLPDRFAILPAIVGYHAVDLDTGALEGFQKLAVDGRQVITLQIFTGCIEPIIVVRVAARLRGWTAVIDHGLFWGQAGFDSEETHFVAHGRGGVDARPRPRPSLGANSIERKAAHESGLRAGLDVGLFEVHEAMVADLLEAMGIGGGLIAIGVAGKGCGVFWKKNPRLSEHDGFSAPPSAGLCLGSKTLRLKRSLSIDFALGPPHLDALPNHSGDARFQAGGERLGDEGRCARVGAP